MHTNTHACCLIDIQITFQSWIQTYLLCCEFAFCFSLCFIAYGPCELASWKNSIHVPHVEREREKTKEKITTTTATTNHQAVIVCTGDCQFLTSCFYWNFSICNYTWTFGTTCTLIIIIFSSSAFNRFFQPFKITVHLPPHTRSRTKHYKAKEKKTTNRDHTIIEYRVRTHTGAHLHVSKCVHMNTNTRAQSCLYRITPFKELWLTTRMGMGARVYACVVVYIFYTALKWKWIKAVNRCYCCCCCYVCIGCLSLFFFRSLFGLSLSNSFIWFDFFQRSPSLFFSGFHSFFFIYSHTQNTIHSLTWMQKK